MKLPEGFKERMKELLGEEYQAFEDSYEKDRVQGLRFNSLSTVRGIRGDWGALKHLTEQETGACLTPVPWAEEGYYYQGDARPGKHPFHEAGVYYIQEPSAMAAGALLDPEPGDLVLDLCAAPGGKSSHLASRLKGRGFLLSNEIHPARARILSQNMERMGVRNGVTSNEDPERLAPRFPEFFDKIAVDAPCSGEGMFRKDQEAAEQWSPEHVAMCARRQQRILELAASMLKPGGRMVYSTCTFAPEENEGVILRFLMDHEDFSLEEPEGEDVFACGNPRWALYNQKDEDILKQEENLEAWRLSRTRRIMPHKLEGEGHFMAVLRRSPEALSSAGRIRMPAYLDKSREKETFKAMEALLKEILACPEDWLLKKEYIMFGDQLYLVPPQMPDMKGMKILRPGLHVGTWKKNRFEPAHALAEALLKEEGAGSYELSDTEAVSYLKGEALSCVPERLTGREKGWVLMCTHGASLGWAKLTGGILKNHYPKGLRWM